MIQERPISDEPSLAGRLARLTGWFILLVLLTMLAFVGGFALRGVLVSKGRGVQILDTSVVLRQVQGIQELATVRYHLERVVALTDPGLLGDERLILIAHGVVKAGIDLSGLEPGDVRVDAATGTVELTLPAAKILDAYLDEKRTQVFMREKPFFRPLNKDLDQIARRDAVNQIRAAAQELGIRDDAQERAEHQIARILQASGATRVVIVFVRRET